MAISGSVCRRPLSTIRFEIVGASPVDFTSESSSEYSCWFATPFGRMPSLSWTARMAALVERRGTFVELLSVRFFLRGGICTRRAIVVVQDRRQDVAQPHVPIRICSRHRDTATPIVSLRMNVVGKCNEDSEGILG